MNGLDIVHVWNDQPFLLNDEKPATFVIFIPQNISFNFHIVMFDKCLSLSHWTIYKSTHDGKEAI